MNGRRHLRAPRALQRGLSLVELLVAITIGAILLGGAVSLFVSNKVTYELTNDLSRLQESARFALDLMLRDIRMAGHFGCADDLSKVNNIVTPAPAAGDLWDTSVPLEGVDNASAAASWSPSGRAIDVAALGAAGGLAPGSDAITLRFATGAAEDVTADGIVNLQVADTSAFAQGSVVVVSDCGGADVLRVQNDPTGSTILQPTASLSRTYEPTNSPSVANLQAVRYYVGDNGVDDADGSPHYSLFREQILPGPAVDRDELVDGVEHMQLLYGVDSDDDGAPDSYLRAGDGGLDQPAEWRNVVAVRIGLLMRTVDEYGNVVDPTRYALLDNDDPTLLVNATADGTGYRFNDRRQRRQFTITAVVRNLQ